MLIDPLTTPLSGSRFGLNNHILYNLTIIGTFGVWIGLAAGVDLLLGAILLQRRGI
jgi:hypothetical protein